MRIHKKGVITGILLLLFSLTAGAAGGVLAKRAMETEFNELINIGLTREEAANFIRLEGKKGAPDQYIAGLKAEIAENPDNYIAYDRLGEAYRSLKRDETNAVKYFKLSVLANRKGYYARNKLGNIYLDKKDLKTARIYFEALVQTNPDFPPGHHGLGIVYALQGDYMHAFNEVSTAKNLYRRLDGWKYFEIYGKRQQYIQDCDDLQAKIKAGAMNQYKQRKISEEIGD
ncbi:MAG: hypothetical protein LBQ97_05970 [Fusobacteriaceae bacterium]|nr:hypothetical protein [Fusobacteriaceae bacterium]